MGIFDIGPEAWAGGGGSGPGGSPEPARIPALTERYTGKVDPEYLARARQVFYDAPSIAIGDEAGTRVTPADWLRQNVGEILGVEATPEQIEKIVSSVFDHQTGVAPARPTIASLSRELLKTLQSQSPVGDSPQKAFAGQTLQEREARRRDWFQDGRFMTSQGLDTQLDALRAYTMLGALEEDPALQLPIFSDFSKFITLGSLINQGNPLNWFRSVDPITDPGAGIRHLASLRLSENDVDPVSARQKEALYWDRLGERARSQEGQYRSSMEGGYYWPYSFMNDVGMARMSEDRANVIANTDENISQFLRDPGMWGGEQGKDLSRLGAMVRREVPIVPEGVDPAVTAEAQRRFGALSDQTHQRLIDEYPLYQEQWNKWMPGTAFDVEKYSFPSPAWNNLATAPAYSLDTITLGTMGLGLPSGIAKHGIRGLAKGLATDLVTDQFTEQPFGATLYSSSNQGDMSQYFQPYGQSNVSDNPGMPGDGGQYRKQFEQEFKPTQNKSIEWLRDYLRTNHPADELQIERNMPNPFTGQRRAR